MVTNNLEKCNALNYQFKSVFNSDNDSPLPNFEARIRIYMKDAIVLNLFSITNILKHLNELNEDKSVGDDKVHPHVIKHASEGFAIPLNIIFTKSFNTGLIPSSWNEANITSIIWL